MNGNFLKSIVTSKNDVPNKLILDAFYLRFVDAHNVEWSREDDVFEALFSESGFEKIAKLNSCGKIIEISTNIKPENLPLPIAERLKKHGVIMNVILLDNLESGQKYEFIIKDVWKVRHLFITDMLGNVLDHKNFEDLI